MKMERVGDRDVVVPENTLDRQFLEEFIMHRKPADVNYWDIKSPAGAPLSQDDVQGKVYVSWSRQGEQLNSRVNTFSVCHNDYGALVVVLVPWPDKPDAPARDS